VCLGRKYMALYVMAQSLSEGFELETSLSLASRLYNVAEGSIRNCWHVWRQSEEAFISSLRGKHAKHQWLLSGAPMQESCKRYIRLSAKLKGDERFTPEKFRDWLNTDIEVDKHLGWHAPLVRLAPRDLSIRTANRYISKLGFYKKFAKKGEFFDKHDDKAVEADRIRYLAEKELLDLTTWRKLPYFDKPEELEARLKELAEGPDDAKPYVELVNDESACNANDAVNHQYIEKGKNAYIRSKSKGAGVMVGAYITEVFGRILQFEGKMAAESLEYGNGRWWNSKKMLKHLREVIEIRKKRLPWARVIWRFDHSSNHTAKAMDALNVYKMNIGFGGKQPVVRNTKVLDPSSLLYDKVQSMVLERGDKDNHGKPIKDELIGKPKGLKRVLEERWGLGYCAQFQGRTRKKQLQQRLAEDLDFQLQTTLIHDLIKELCPHDLVRFYPKYHCEFPAIERFWCDHKAYCRKYCKYNIKGLRKVVPQGLDAVCADSVRRYFGLCRRYEVAYRKEVSTQDIYKVVKTYTSHRRVIDSTGVVAKLVASGKLSADDFKGLCSCSECDTDQEQICVQPRCVHHGTFALTGKVLTDSDVPTMGFLEVPGKVGSGEAATDVVADETADEPASAVEAKQDDVERAEEVEEEEQEEEEEEEGGAEESGDDIGEVAIACTKRHCRKWRDVEKEWLDEQGEEFMFTCEDANTRCRAKCAYCNQRSFCLCECDECDEVGSACTCPSFK
jgi:hypothetical protein